jgi:hypothetical protein
MNERRLIMSHIVSIKQRGVSFAYSRGSGSEAVALALRFILGGECNVSIISPRGVVYAPADFHLLSVSDERPIEKLARRVNDATGKAVASSGKNPELRP